MKFIAVFAVLAAIAVSANALEYSNVQVTRRENAPESGKKKAVV